MEPTWNLSGRPARRRTVLSAAAGMTIASTLGVTAARGRVRHTREDHRVVVVGSGFGGGVAALRLARAGVAVTVLERGRRWPSATTIADLSALDKRAVFHGSDDIRPLLSRLGVRPDLEPYAGLVEAVRGDNILSLCPAGVGGGALVSHGMALAPTAAMIAAWLPERLDRARLAAVHYPRVARTLNATTTPVAPPWLFAEQARRAGVTVDTIPTHPADATYIRRAEATGRVAVATHHHVTSVARAADGRWEVRVDHTDDAGVTIERKVLSTKALILAAGSVGTTRLLLRAKATGAIPDLPDGVGQDWGTNGDRFYLWTDFDEGFGPGGPAGHGSTDWADPATATTVVPVPLPAPLRTTRTTLLVGLAASIDRGHFQYDAATDRVTPHWPESVDPAAAKVIDDRVRAITDGVGVVADATHVAACTWHPLGGAAMGPVCDLDGRVHGQSGLYVLDGALIPGTTGGAPPAMTIAAVIERAMDTITTTDVGTLI